MFLVGLNNLERSRVSSLEVVEVEESFGAVAEAGGFLTEAARVTALGGPWSLGTPRACSRFFVRVGGERFVVFMCFSRGFPNLIQSLLPNLFI